MEKNRSRKLKLNGRARLFLPIAMLLIMAGSAAALNIAADFTGPGIVMDFEEKIHVGLPFQVNIYMENTPGDPPRLGISAPFRFYGTGDVTTLYAPGSVTVDAAFMNIWDIYGTTVFESWDGDLTNGVLPGDQFNYSGITTSGWQPGSGVMLALTIDFAGIADECGSVGQFCLDSGDFTNDVYDWLWDAPSPSFGPICLDIVCWSLPPFFTNCPTSGLAVQMDHHIDYDLDAENLEGDPMQYVMLSGPGAVESSSGLWSWEPTESDLGLHLVEVCVEDSSFQCPYSGACRFHIIAYKCGDANGDGEVNILDVTYIINYLYLGGPEPLGIESADVNSDGVVNINDITYLVLYLYMEGPEPACP